MIITIIIIHFHVARVLFVCLHSPIATISFLATFDFVLSAHIINHRCEPIHQHSLRISRRDRPDCVEHVNIRAHKARISQLWRWFYKLFYNRFDRWVIGFPFHLTMHASIYFADAVHTFDAPVTEHQKTRLGAMCMVRSPNHNNNSIHFYLDLCSLFDHWTIETKI